MLKTLKSVYLVHTHQTSYIYNSWRHAGHSKWQNIRHIKAEKDGQRAATFTRLRRHMEVAVKGGRSADPSSNLQLANIIEQARKANMPVSSINNIIKSLKEESSSSGELQTIELLGPGGSAFVICVDTRNVTLLKTNINAVLRKSRGLFSVGTISHLFECRSIIQTSFPPCSSLDDAVNVALELEIDDVAEISEGDQRYLEFMCEPLLLHKCRTQLEHRKYTVYSAELDYSPLVQIVISKDDLQSVNSLYTKLQDVPDIVNIFDNIMWPEDT